MSLVLSDILDAIRDRHADFSRVNVPHKALATFLTSYQRRLAARAVELNPDYLAQQSVVLLDLTAANATNVVGVGTSGGRPVLATTGGNYEARNAGAGSAIEIDLDAASAVILWPEARIAFGGATSTMIMKAVGVDWVVNAYVGKYVRITAGPGVGQVREITSNSTNQLFFGALAVTPTTESLFEIVQATAVAGESVGVVTNIPSEAERVGYLVRLNANGVPFVDTTKPLVARYDTGVPLPPHYKVLGGIVRSTATGAHLGSFRTDGPARGDQNLIIRTFSARGYRTGRASAYIQNNTLYLIGPKDDWDQVASIDLRYVPIPPVLDDLTDLFLLPDHAYDVLAAQGALFAGRRVNSLTDFREKPLDLSGLAAEATDAEAGFFATVSGSRAVHSFRPREVW